MPNDTTETSARALTPMLAQYLAIKKQHPDAILFYRMGDFYEMFMEDATTAAPVMEVQLTSRDRNSDNPIPMCGVPHHSATVYLQKLLAAGFKVAICEQVEDPATAKGIVKREVIRVVTPALIGDPELVPPDATNYLLCLFEHENETIDVCLLDLLACQVKQGTLSSAKQLTDLFCETWPKEILVNRALTERKWLKDLLKLFPQTLVTQRDEYFIPRKAPKKKDASLAVEALTSYLKETQKVEEVPYLSAPLPLFQAGTMTLDATTLSALEITRGVSQGAQGKTLAEVLDYTVTPMGRRMLKEWLSRPLCHLTSVEARLGAVGNLVADALLSAQLKTSLGKIRDLERITMKTALGLAMPRDLVAIRNVLETIPEVKKLLRGAESSLLLESQEKLSPLSKLTDRLQEALEDQPPATYREGNIFKSTFHPEIAELRRLSQDAKGTIAGIETREKARTGISTLKVKYSRVFGYTIEISKSQLARVPPEYIRKQTIANGERFITAELKAFEEKVITADYKLKKLEEALFLEIRDVVAEQSAALLANARTLGSLDVLQSFAEASRVHGYARPKIHSGWQLEIREGRHPVIETLLPQGSFVPNSVSFSEDDCRTLIITGPNMAGKSTIMRQVALIAVMAQAGCYVPAESAELPLIDAIFTRIGSSDDLTRGRSTFMVEMTEVARILEQASPQSLILIDEIGRGTSTYDGLSLAWSLLEFIHTEVRAKTLFATHFHEVTSLEKLLPQVKNANVLVDKWKNEIVFLHKLAPGICNQSYGIEVAKLAHLPSKVLLRAKDILGHLETQSRRGDRERNRALAIHENQMAFFDEPKPLESPPGLET